ncbi:MAG: hypothetical protein ACUVRY_05460 [Thermoanaerobaculaceae bacterium]
MARPDYIICLECESEVEDFTWRDGEIRRAHCEVCGNDDPDAFSLPEDMEDLDEEEEEDWDEEEEDFIDEDEDFEEEDE